MTPSSHERNKQHAFDSFCKKVLKHEARDHYDEMKRQRERLWLRPRPRPVSAIKQKQSSTIGENPTLNCCRCRNPPQYHRSPRHGEQAGSIVTVW